MVGIILNGIAAATWTFEHDKLISFQLNCVREIIPHLCLMNKVNEYTNRWFSGM